MRRCAAILADSCSGTVAAVVAMVRLCTSLQPVLRRKTTVIVVGGEAVAVWLEMD